MAHLDFQGSILDGTGGVGEEERLLFRADQAEQQAGLSVVIVIVFPKIPVGGSSLQGQRRLGEFRLLLPFTVTVGLIAQSTALVAVHPHGAVAVITVIRAAGGIDGNLVMVDAESVALSVSVGEEPSLEHLVG
jgi:hypothetical protein